jgi:hypothetical protein
MLASVKERAHRRLDDALPSTAQREWGLYVIYDDGAEIQSVDFAREDDGAMIAHATWGSERDNESATWTVYPDGEVVIW